MENDKSSTAQSGTRSSSSPSLLSLPPEVRLQILRYLLRGEEHDYKTICPFRGKISDLWGLYPNILRACSKIYEEGSTVLYEENRFQITGYADEYGALDLVPNVLYHKNLARIKHLSLELVQTYKYCHKITPECVALMLRYVERTGCSLKTLWFNFLLECPWDFAQLKLNHLRYPPRRLDTLDGTLSLLHDHKVLNVHRGIGIVLRTDDESDATRFGGFVESVAEATGWTAFLLRHLTVDYSNGAEPMNHVWIWIVQEKEPDTHITRETRNHTPIDT